MSGPAPSSVNVSRARSAPRDDAAGRPVVMSRRRGLQLALATIWLIDGLLQFQSYMFTKSFATDILAPTAQGNPGWISASILWSAHVVEANPVWTNGLFATLQLLIGLAIASRRLVKPALVVSIIWSLVVWWFGEGLGGLLLPGSSALAGAPGAVLIYAILAVLLWPAPETPSGSFVAAAPIGRVPAKVVWIVLWAGLAALNLEPDNLTRQSVHGMVDGMGDGQPAWLNGIITAFTFLSDGRGVVLTVIGTVVLALVAVGVLFPPPILRAAVVLAVVVSIVIWVVGEALGGVFGGQGTDLNSGPLLGLFAVVYWPSTSRSDSSEPPVSVMRESRS